jgi:hypothetical protein
MVTEGTIFQHKNIHEATRRFPDSNTSNQIDCVFIDSHTAVIFLLCVATEVLTQVQTAFFLYETKV